MRKKNIKIGTPFLPPLEDFLPMLSSIWNSKVLSNNGPYVIQFEQDLKDYLKVDEVITFSNATIALISIIKCMNLKGSIITTPFSFVASGNVIPFCELEPKFGDIDRQSYNLDPNQANNLIDDNVSAIIPVHIFSRPCDIQAFEKIQKEKKIKVIYDASHAFGSMYKNKSILSYGDASVVSFHATKLLNTFEGGAVITNDKILAAKLREYRTFGLNIASGEVNSFGLNGKLNEFQAALGVLQLKNIEKNINDRKKISEIYTNELQRIKLIKFPSKINNHVDNFSYYAIELSSKIENKKNQILNLMEKNGIFCKSYFDPIITDQNVFKKLSDVKFNYKQSSDLSKKIICLPIYPEMTKDDVIRICNLLKENIK